MNRLSNKFAAATLAVMVMASASALAKEKAPKKKKNQDLSANPLANVNSKQPDKELFDKAMVALKKGRFDVARLDLQTIDRKSTRLNSSHLGISYAVFCLKKKKKT